MLYISRIAGMNKWEVTDTDDGVSQIVGVAGLRHALISGVEIKGVEIVTKVIGGFETLDVGKVEVYQPALKSTGKRAKAMTLLGIDVRVDGPKILQFTYVPSLLKQTTTVRLSDIGSECANFVFTSCRRLDRDMSMTIILDDKIKIRAQTFSKFFNNIGIVLDIRELSSDKMAGYVYEEYITRYNGAIEFIDKRILDNPERQAFWRAVDIVHHGKIPEKKPSAEINLMVGKRYIAEFDKLSNIKLSLRDDKLALVNAEAYAKHIVSDDKFWKSQCQDFGQVRIYDYGVLRFIQDCVPCQYFKWSYFRHYMVAFEPIDEIKAIFVKLCNRVNNWALDLAVERCWARKTLEGRYYVIRK